jgi:hypothetical protein
MAIGRSSVRSRRWRSRCTQAGQSGYSGGFVQHYVRQVVYPRGMPRQKELVARVSILVGNAVVYAFVCLLATRETE